MASTGDEKANASKESEEVYVAMRASDPPATLEAPKVGALPPIAHGSLAPTGSAAASARSANGTDTNGTTLPSSSGTRSNIPTVQRQTNRLQNAFYGDSEPQSQAFPSATFTLQAPAPCFEFLWSCRMTAWFLFGYYISSIFLFQPFFLGTLGLCTAYVGHNACRMPMAPTNVKWMEYFVFLNYGMILANIWSGVVSFLMSARVSGSVDFGAKNALLIGCNILIHLWALRVGKRFQAELLRSNQHQGAGQSAEVLPRIV